MVEGEYSRTFRKLIYSPVDENQPRTSENYQQHLQTASATGSPVFGVKGPTVLSSLLRIPEDVPFDPMHLLYIGINKALLNAIIKYHLLDIESVSSIIERVKVPHYFRRKPRNLDTEFSLWKAQEHRHFLLYFSPFVLFSTNKLDATENSHHLFLLYHPQCTIDRCVCAV